MKRTLLGLGLFLMVSPILAGDYPDNDRFNLAYDEVNDMTTISDKIAWGEGIPDTGDALTGHRLFLSVQIRYQGKRYDPSDTKNTTAELSLIELHDNVADTGFLYEDQDNVTLLVDGNRFKLGKAEYAQRTAGDDFVGKRLLEVLMVPIDLEVLDSISKSKKALGAITAKNADASKPFNFGTNDLAYVSKALNLLDSLKKK